MNNKLNYKLPQIRITSEDSQSMFKAIEEFNKQNGNSFQIANINDYVRLAIKQLNFRILFEGLIISFKPVTEKKTK